VARRGTAAPAGDADAMWMLTVIFQNQDAQADLCFVAARLDQQT